MPPPPPPPAVPPAPLPPLHLHLLEAPHAVQDVKLLPALGEVDFAVNVIWVSQMNKGQVLQNQASEREKGAAGQGLGKQAEVFVTHGQESWPKAAPHRTTSSCCCWQRCNSKLEGKVLPAPDMKVFRCQTPFITCRAESKGAVLPPPSASPASLLWSPDREKLCMCTTSSYRTFMMEESKTRNFTGINRANLSSRSEGPYGEGQGLQAFI